jgi:hypothetical protein
MEKSYDTGTPLPTCPEGSRITEIRFNTCPGTDLVIRPVKDVVSMLDKSGVPRDSWWSIETPKLPTRAIRLFDGSKSLHEFLGRYGFLDASGCVHHKHATITYGKTDCSLRDFMLDKCVPIEMQDATGVPQFLKNSGICWFASLCCVFFSRPDVLSMLSEYMPSNMLQLCRRSLFDRDSAQKLRNMWWYDYAVGDDVDLPPEMDGRNGFSEFTTLCAKLKIPLLRYSMEENKLQPMGNTVKDRKGKSVTVKLPKGCEKHFMVMRFIDGNHHKKNPILRRIILNGNRYRFLGVTSGNRKCGHQIGWVTLDSWRHVMAGDADLHKDGIGPLFVHFDGPEWKNKWWDGCREMLHVAKFGPGRKDFCNLSPHNEADDLLDSYRGAASIPGKNSLDIIYLSV